MNMNSPAPLGRFENKLKRLFASGRAAWGCALVDCSNVMAKMSISTGIDFLWVDLEHRPYYTHEVQHVPIMCRLAGCPCVVRVAGLDPQLIKKALDIGANTVMVPQVNTADEAKRAVEYAKYPPQGSRGISPYWATFLDVNWNDYLPVANDETAVIVQVETPEGIKNLDAIAAVDGVDVVFAGPMDLSASLGHIGRPEHPDVQKFLADFPQRVIAAGKAAGITFVDPDQCAKSYEQGYRFISCGALVHHGTRGLTAELKRFRGLEGA